ncbi:MAG TPA: amidohydrolase family protein [Candidatus Acidoferrales bacterium]|nr:amidohydrolase family protein [Candidatus Acidoferrales bacterium]
MRLRGLTVYPEPGSAPFYEATVVVRDGVVAGIDASASAAEDDGPEIDCTGMTALAGFWNCHVHFFERKWADAASIPNGELEAQLASFTRYGFTRVVDLSSPLENTLCVRARVESGDVAGPAILTTGEGLVPPGAMPPDATLAAMGVAKTAMPEVADAASARAQARRLLDAGADGVKLFASGAPSRTPVQLSVETMRAAVDEAHRDGELAFVHPNDAGDVERALEAGVDVVAHTTPRSGAWDDALLAGARRLDAALIPTLGLWPMLFRHDRFSTVERLTDAAVEQLRAWREAGNAVLFGTDYGAVDADPSPEYALMARAGMDARAILASLTTEPARRFRVASQAGRIAPGFHADLVILREDPFRRIDAFANVALTVRGGRVVYRAT